MGEMRLQHLTNPGMIRFPNESSTNRFCEMDFGHPQFVAEKAPEPTKQKQRPDKRRGGAEPTLGRSSSSHSPRASTCLGAWAPQKDAVP